MIGDRISTTQRVPAGIPGLDDLLHGGFLEGDAVLVAGAPGTGKSTLGMQYLYEGVMRYDEAGLFITFEEFPQQIYRDALNFGWDFRQLEGEEKLKVLFTSPELLFQDIKRQEGIFPEMIREIGARRVVVDSITHFQRLASNTSELREMIYGLINALKREGLTPLLLRELVEGEVLGTVSEEYTADAVLHLTMERVNGQRMRFLEVLKSRGSEHMPAKSLFHITDGGLDVVPPFHEPFFRYQDAVSVGVPDLDALLGGGIPYGAFYLVEIAPDLHQEILELNYMLEAARSGDVLLELATAGTRVERLRQLAQSYGMRFEFDQALEATALRFIHAQSGRTLGAAPEAPVVGTADAVDVLEETFEETRANGHGRLFLDLTRLLTSMPEPAFFSALLRVHDMVQRHAGVCLGFLNPDAVPAAARQKLLTEADGIVRVWKDGNYRFIQVVKTLNSVQSPVFTITETNNPPFLRIQ